MKRFLFTLLAVVLVAALGVVFILPYGLGFVAQQRYAQLANNLAASPVINVVAVNYQRHWFSSDATAVLTLKPLMAAGTSPNNPSTYTIIVKQHIQHGPLLSTVNKDGDSELLLGQALFTTQAQTPFGKLDGILWLEPNGALFTRMTAPTLSYTDPLANILTLHEFSGAFKLSADGAQFTANFIIPDSSFKTAALEQHIHGINMHYDLHKSASGLFLGQKQLAIDNITWNAASLSTPLQFIGIALQASNHEQDHRIDNDIVANVTKVVFNNASYGPQHLALAINQLDAATLVALKNSRRPHKTVTYHSMDEAVTQTVSPIATLLSKGLQIQLKELRVNTPWGSPSMEGTITLPSTTKPTINYHDIVSTVNVYAQADVPATFLLRCVEQYLTFTQAHSTPPANPPITADNNVAPQAEQMINAWINKKWLLPKDNGYQVSVIYQNQQMLINNQPLDTATTAPTSTPIPTSAAVKTT